MKFTVGDKEYTIKFGYEVTAKSKIMSLVAKTDNKPIDENEDMATAMMGAVEDTMEVLAKMLLVGLQRFHSDEFGYDYNETDLNKAESMGKVYNLLDAYFDDENADFGKLYSELEEELVANGFLSKMFKEEMAKAKAELEKMEKSEKKTAPKKKSAE